MSESERARGKDSTSIFRSVGSACPVESYSSGVPDVDQLCASNVADELQRKHMFCADAPKRQCWCFKLTAES